jgi:hypothetical protein
MSFTSRPIYPLGKSPRYALDRRLSGPQSLSECSGGEKISFLSQESNTDPSAVQPVASRYPGSEMWSHTCLVTQSRWKLAVTSRFIRIPTMSLEALTKSLLLKEPGTVTDATRYDC